MSNGQHPAGDQLIYVVDDDDAIRTLLVDYLRDEGFRVLEGKSGGEVLPTVQQEAPDVVLMDLRMPDQSGMQALESVHSHAPDIPVLIMTAYNSSSTAIQAIQQGAYDYITKPFDLADVLHTIRRALEHRALSQRVRQMEQSPERETRASSTDAARPYRRTSRPTGRAAPGTARV